MTQPDPILSPNLRAFLDTIAWSELNDGLLTKETDNGYRVIVGSTAAKPILFDSYADHPRRKMDIPRLHIYSTAAGRYQIVMRTWDELQAHYRFPDFGPKSQDWAARALIFRRHALKEVEGGNIENAITKCCNEWASFPGNNYGQGAHKMERLLAHYETFRKRYA